MTVASVDPQAQSAQPAVVPGASRDQLPALGFRNYWYPAIEAKSVRRKPVQVKLLGDDVALFRNPATGKIHAFADRCPHRGALLSHGRIYYPGTLSCPYHGWTFDTAGKLVAVLSEGPSCPMVGKIQLRVYPTEELRGLVWIRSEEHTSE